jgi:hypothetical protein
MQTECHYSAGLKVAAPLYTFMKEQQHSIIRSLISECVKPETENEQEAASFLIAKTQVVLDSAICREDYADSLLRQMRCTLRALHASGEHCYKCLILRYLE